MKKGTLLVLLLFLCVLCCGVIFGGFALFGYFENDDKCVYLGPLSSPPEGLCKDKKDSEDNDTNNGSSNQNNSDLKEYKNDEYSFQYPKNWYVVEGSILFVYTQNPSSASYGSFSDNMNITSVQIGSFDFSDKNCQQYGELVQQQSAALYDYSELIDSKKMKINGVDACVAEMNGTLNDVDLEQVQYMLLNEDTGMSYYITLSVGSGSSNMEDLRAVAETFELL